MAQVKDVVVKVLAEINTLHEKNRGVDRGMAGSEILLRYESKLIYDSLKKLLEKYSKDETELSVASLQPLVEFLQIRFHLIKNTDAIYNHNPASLANQACVMLAKHIFEALKPFQDTNVQPQDAPHYYDYLFGGLRCNQFISSKGRLTDLQLHEFFWGDDGTPIETLQCLEKYREALAIGEDTYPPHVCLEPAALQVRTAGNQLKVSETLRLTSYCAEADRYVKAMEDKKKSVAEKDACRQNLVEMVKHPNFAPQYTYNEKKPNYDNENFSNINLLKNNFLTLLKVNDITSFATFMQKSVAKADWKEFVSAIDNHNFDMLILPKLNDGTCDTSMMLASNAEKFRLFVNSQQWIEDGESDFNNALLFLLTELYLRKRTGEGVERTGTIGHFTGLVGHTQQQKEGAAGVFQDFLQDNDYHLCQLDTYLKDKVKTIHSDALNSDRLLFLTSKAKELGPSQADSARNLAKIARVLTASDPSKWHSIIAKFDDNRLQSYIDSSGGLKRCIKTKNHYIQDNDGHNKAILFILTECYLRNRRKGDSYNNGLFW